MFYYFHVNKVEFLKIAIEDKLNKVFKENMWHQQKHNMTDVQTGNGQSDSNGALLR